MVELATLSDVEKLVCFIGDIGFSLPAIVIKKNMVDTVTVD